MRAFRWMQTAFAARSRATKQGYAPLTDQLATDTVNALAAITCNGEELLAGEWHFDTYKIVGLINVYHSWVAAATSRCWFWNSLWLIYGCFRYCPDHIDHLRGRWSKEQSKSILTPVTDPISNARIGASRSRVRLHCSDVRRVHAPRHFIHLLVLAARQWLHLSLARVVLDLRSDVDSCIHVLSYMALSSYLQRCSRKCCTRTVLK